MSKCFPTEKLLMVQSKPQYADIVNHLGIGETPGLGQSMHNKDRFFYIV